MGYHHIQNMEEMTEENAWKKILSWASEVYNKTILRNPAPRKTNLKCTNHFKYFRKIIVNQSRVLCERKLV